MEENKNEITVMSVEESQVVQADDLVNNGLKLAQMGIAQMCAGVRMMHDGKLYKHFGFQNFEDYCKSKGFSKSYGERLVRVAAMLEEKNAESIPHFEKLGTAKLFQLAMLEPEQREEIIQTVDVESVTVKELKAKIAELEPKVSNLTVANQMYQTENQKLKVQVRERDEEIQAAKMMYDELQDERNDLFAENNTLADELDELRSQGEPVIDAVYSDNSEEVERLTRRTEELEAELQNTKAKHIKELAKARSEARQGAVQKIPDVSHELISLAQIARTATGNLMHCMKDHPGASKYYPDYFRTVLERFTEIEKEQAEKKV